MMHKPQMIIFDYGHTLLYEPGFDAKGVKRLLLHISPKIRKSSLPRRFMRKCRKCFNSLVS